LFATIAFALCIQIGTNYSNDYYDGLRGVDAHRIGPERFVGSGAIEPSQMRFASHLLFAFAFGVSLPLVANCGVWAFFFVFSSIAFGILYTGGPRPLGYMGLGELFVFLYFGPVAVLGTAYVQCHAISGAMLLASVSPALLSCAILIANNLRDHETDRIAHKNTLVVRFGKTFGACEYALSVSLALLLPLCIGCYSPLALIVPALFLIRKAFTFQTTKEVVPLLPQTALLLILFTTFFCLERWLGAA